MWLNITGKEEALKDIEKAKKLISEAEKILYYLPQHIGLEVKSEAEKKTIPSGEADGIEEKLF